MFVGRKLFEVWKLVNTHRRRKRRKRRRINKNCMVRFEEEFYHQQKQNLIWCLQPLKRRRQFFFMIVYKSFLWYKMWEKRILQSAAFTTSFFIEGQSNLIFMIWAVQLICTGDNIFICCKLRWRTLFMQFN